MSPKLNRVWCESDTADVHGGLPVVPNFRRDRRKLVMVKEGGLAGEEYTIADMASYPWTVSHEKQGQNLDDFPHLKRWFEAIKARPATVRAYEKAKEINPALGAPMSDAAKKVLFGQTAAVVR